MTIFQVEGKTYKIRTPNSSERRNARKIYNQEMAQCIAEGVPIRAQIPTQAEKLGIWTTEDKMKLQELKDDLLDLVKKSEQSKGKVKEKIDKEISSLQESIQSIQNPFLELYLHTAERYASVLQDDYLLSVCLTNEDGSPYCSNLDDFYSKETDKVVSAAQNQYFNIVETSG